MTDSLNAVTEKVARAICCWRHDSYVPQEWESLSGRTRQAYRDQANAAIRVLEDADLMGMPLSVRTRGLVYRVQRPKSRQYPLKH